MASNDNASWGANPAGGDEYGIQMRPMGLKVHYTFDREGQERCLARWPQILHVRTIPMDEQNTIGVVELKTCLQAVVDCSPELVGHPEQDYTVYAVDYSEPDIPLVGQGMLSRAIDEPAGSPDQAKVVIGRVTKNLLAIFGNGIKETLEVKLKLTAVPRIARSIPAPPANTTPESTLIRRASATPAPSENSEWNSFRQSTSSLGQSAGTNVASSHLVPIAPEPVKPFNSNYEARSDVAASSSRGPQLAPRSRPSSVGPGAGEPHHSAPPPDLSVPEKQPVAAEEQAVAPAPNRTGKPQSRPGSRASNRAPSGRPRGRPRKRPLPVEGSTSGYEDGTDADDGPPRSRKRASTTKVERSNTAVFGSAPDSLRVAASTSGSLRNFRPISIAGDAPVGNPGSEIPRAPTPIPDSRFSGFHARPIAPSNLNRELNGAMGPDGSFASSYLELSRSASFGQDTRSPADSAARSPSRAYTDEPSPADIGSSPPVPRTTLYSIQSSPAPSSPILPPLPIPIPQPDSGFMSGGLEEETANKAPADATSQAIADPKSKPKPRRSRAKKTVPAKAQQDLVIHTETPGPPELLPQTSLYNPPHFNRKNGENNKAPAVSGPPSLPAAGQMQSGATELGPVDSQSPENSLSQEEAGVQGNITTAETAFTEDLMNNLHQQNPGPLYPGNPSFTTPAADDSPRCDEVQPVVEQTSTQTEPPSLPKLDQAPPAQPELPTIPASDPVLPQLTLPMPLSEPPYPQTDAIETMDEKSNKNYVKKQTIKQKLDDAINMGQMPSYCRNCAALQTPTWRKIWRQEHKGVPTYHEYSEKPGHVTAIKILQRDEEGTPKLYEVLKKSLGPNDSKSDWEEVLLCNPCGIWFSKFKDHRPAEKWEKDEQRLSQTRKKRANGAGLPRSKKARAKGDAQTNLTSEACLPTDPAGPPDGSLSPKESIAKPTSQVQQLGVAVDEDAGKGCEKTDLGANFQGLTRSRGSTHSRGSGTPGSPIAIDDDLDGIRRLLFPSPRKAGEQRILGDVAVNIVQTSPGFQSTKEGQHAWDKENGSSAAFGQDMIDDDESASIFGTPIRPSTPPPKMGSGGPFKTPTHPTPSHRPITRSVTRSMRSGGPITSPSQLLIDQTPTRATAKTPRSSAAKRHSPDDVLPSQLFGDQLPDTPLTRSLSQMLSATGQYPMPTSPRGFGLDLSHLPIVGGDHFDFDFLDDNAMPSSPPSALHGRGDTLSFGHSFAYDDETSVNPGHL
ncbi:hypothetical protein GGS23DRAFT_429464 [Durotheca rogersii]|uniref:uncharacterized protein n=1 Tax=Durotheca rogersii TaxID=419775 RepID=UPI0022211601|nr:uncharacterized protein GGS23DRAFT_429464 [Durotheca rogersii]KAI5865494.1 hypothetical protein GGS23DRAFT_429464 [Durotheca rogersii]